MVVQMVTPWGSHTVWLVRAGKIESDSIFLGQRTKRLTLISVAVMLGQRRKQRVSARQCVSARQVVRE